MKKAEVVAHGNLATETDRSEQKIEFDWDAVLDHVKKDLYFPPSWLFSIKVSKTEDKLVTLEAKNPIPSPLGEKPLPSTDKRNRPQPLREKKVSR